ncbi:MAG: NAD-dependent succinate-semialdehyde dehydrogenase [Motiliproteus sp.]|nr:NAD-dependent succinate-semialdehyde dehydrogenase [Motiliproteus sp.]MCW9051673.1 NAD-dependent succinate-semialdehyde dehydrogenase [Motiliproteus sp.]
MSLTLNDTSLLKHQLYIDGQWRDGEAGETFAVLDPASGDTVVHMASGGTTETRAAIECAHQALEGWKKLTAKNRSQLLRRWYDLIIENQEDLALIMTAEQGKPLAESRMEILYGASFIEWFAEEAKRVYGDVIPTVAHDRRLITIKQPVGVVAAITPWNFPSAMLTRKAGPALAVGCTCVLKPAEETPLSALALAELAHRAGIPPGVLNVVVGKDPVQIGNELTSNHKVAKVTFTGSTAVGKLLIKQSAESVKKVSMELGGNAPILVFDDADIDKAVDGALASKYRNAGQTCICANRILVQDGIYDQFVEKFCAKVETFQLGNGLDQGVTIGPMINSRAVANVTSLVEDALAKGAKAPTGAKNSELGACFYQPTVLTDVTADMRVFNEEIFGPVAPVFRFSDEAEAIAMANDTEYGLAAYLYSQDMGRIWRASEALEYGMVGCNEVAITSEVIPFGGIKQSGLGREGSKYGADEYLEIKYICMGGLDSL